MVLIFLQRLYSTIAEWFFFQVGNPLDQTLFAQNILLDSAVLGPGWEAFKASFLIGITAMLSFFALFGSIRIRGLPYFYYSIYLFAIFFYFFNHHHFLFPEFFNREIGGYQQWELNRIIFSVASTSYMMYAFEIIRKKAKVTQFQVDLLYAVVVIELGSAFIASFFFFIYQDIPLGMTIKAAYAWMPLITLPFIYVPHLRSTDKLIRLVLIGGIFVFLGAGGNYILAHIPTDHWLIQPIDLLQICIIVELVLFVMGVGLAIDIHQANNAERREMLIIELKTKDKQNQQLRNELESKVKFQSMQIEEEIAKKLQAEYKEKLTELEMKALRSQMNPHFLFNCLNSVKRLVLEKDHKMAQKYIDKFAILLRTILNNSREKSIALQSEIDFIELYLELENLRFKRQFDFKINCDPTIDTENIEVPPMILQPYVENAIWHGLMHKKDGQRRLEISILKKGSEIVVSIRDNGIGRKMRTKIKNTQPTRTRSLGGQITAERLELINSTTSKNEVSAKIIDLFDKDSQPIGTEVIVRLAGQ